MKKQMESYLTNMLKKPVNIDGMGGA